jgi:hypothetical protein
LNHLHAPDAAVARWAARPIDVGLGLASLRPLVIGPASLPEVTDPAEAERETELAVLSAVAHGNGTNGLAVAQAALLALGQLDAEHGAVCFQIIWNVLREPLRRALEARVMERTTEDKRPLLPWMQDFFDLGVREGELKGLREGELKALRDALVRLLARAGITLTETDRTRVQQCTDAATLDRWVENVLGAKSAADVFS